MSAGRVNEIKVESPSLLFGAGYPPLSESTVGEALDAAARRWPDREALVSAAQGVRWTYAELAERVARVAAAFTALGMVAGDRVGIWSPNCAEWTVTQFATAKIGVILVNINPSYQADELKFTLNKVRAKCIVVASRFRDKNYIKVLAGLCGNGLGDSDLNPIKSDLPFLGVIIQIGEATQSGAISFDSLYRYSPEREFSRFKAHDAINIQFTSGTTGQPKGAVLSHRNIVNNGYFVGLSMGLTAGDRLCIPVPLYHCFGMVMGNLACVCHGATMVYPSAGFEAERTLKTIEQERCTGVLGVPTMFISMLELPSFDSFDLTSLRGGIMAGSPCPIATMRSVISRMNMAEVTIAYGMTETSPVSFQSTVDDNIELRVKTVGRIQPHLQVKLINTNGEAVPVGETGEICTRGYSVMQGYWEDALATREAIDADGWMHTGDLATIDSQGYCQIVGRLKDVVIRGGENIYPREVEEILQAHPMIKEAHVVGIPDTRYGEELCAWIRTDESAGITMEEVVTYCRQRMARYKTPRYIRFVDSFPMTVTGKVQKYEIRAIMLRDGY
jgi:fatty-acyl-CoA synthase